MLGLGETWECAGVGGDMAVCWGWGRHGSVVVNTSVLHTKVLDSRLGYSLLR